MAERVTDQAFVEFVVKQLVDKPDAVQVDRTVDEMGVLITLTVDPQDMGMVIGREGATAKAIRTLLRVVGARDNARVNLKINEPEGGERRKRADRSDDVSNRNDDADDATTPTRRTLDEVVGDLGL